MKFVTVAYCTRGGYEAEASRLRESMELLNMPHQVRVIESLGTWQKNCLYKAVFIREMLEKYKKPVLYVDADAVFHKIPVLIETLEADFAVHYFRNAQLASGTLFFNYTAPALNLLDAWIDKNRHNPKDRDQDNLQRVLEKPGWTNRIRIHYLPAEYCKICDLHPEVQDPVIEHFQASRKLRQEVNTTATEHSKYKEQWQTGYRQSRCAIPMADYVRSAALPDDKLLEVGCGNGLTIKELLNHGIRCTGADITLAGIKGDKTGFVEAPVWRLPFSDDQFDFTFSTDLMEHLPLAFVEPAIVELMRVTRRKMAHCIATFPDQRNGVELHLTVKTIDWWQELFKRNNVKGLELEIVDRKDFLVRMGGEI
jgi:hypothetical protein